MYSTFLTIAASVAVAPPKAVLINISCSFTSKISYQSGFETLADLIQSLGFNIDLKSATEAVVIDLEPLVKVRFTPSDLCSNRLNSALSSSVIIASVTFEI